MSNGHDYQDEEYGGYGNAYPQDYEEYDSAPYDGFMENGNSLILDQYRQATDAVNSLLGKTAKLMEVYRLDSMQIREDMQRHFNDALAWQQQETAAWLQKELKQKLDDAGSKHIQNMETLHESMKNQIVQFNQYLSETNSKNKRLLFHICTCAVVCLTLLFGGGAWLSYHYASVIKKNQLDAELLTVINESDLFRCGDRLCARTEKNKLNGFSIIRKRKQ